MLSALSRTVFLREPPDDLRQTADGVVTGFQKTLRFM
jgi:hypothetical protein